MTEFNKLPTICLNMIVKNESHIIEESLNKLCDKIKFDYWVIADTGSTDNTPDIIINFFKKRNIPGELKYDEWKNFGYNRTSALNHAYNKTDLLLIFDADDELVGELPFPSKINYDKYLIKFGLHNKYNRCCLINNRKQFKYVGVLHEYIECITPNSTTFLIEGNYHFISGRTSSRNFDPKKYLNDALILEKGYLEAKESNDSIFNRYSFYCANSYNDYNDVDNSIKWYKNTLTLDGWNQEKYISCLRLFNLFNKKQMIESAVYYALKSYAYDKERVECIFELIKHYTIENIPLVANNYYLLIKDYYENKYLNDNFSDKLFVDISIYEFYLPYYMIIVAERIKDYNTGIKMYEMIFEKKCESMTQWYFNNLIYNVQFFIDKLNDNNKGSFFLKFENYIKLFYEKGNFEFEIKFLLKYANYGLNINNCGVIPEPIKYMYYNKECYYSGFSNNELKPGIPKVVYYTFKNDNLPDNIKEIISNNKNLCPNYEFKFYDDDDCDLFIKSNFPEIVYNAYKKINPVYGAFKADFFRYCILYINGGVYIDIKSSFTKNLDDIIHNNDMCLLYEGKFSEKWRNVNKSIEQWILIYAPKHPYLKTMINILIHSILTKYVPKKVNQYNIPDNYTKIKILNVSGPDAYSNAVNLSNSLYNFNNKYHRVVNYYDFTMLNTGDYSNMYSMNNVKHYSEYTESFYI